MPTERVELTHVFLSTYRLRVGAWERVVYRWDDLESLMLDLRYFRAEEERANPTENAWKPKT